MPKKFYEIDPLIQNCRERDARSAYHEPSQGVFQVQVELKC
jgi:hypothetical protein